MDYEPCLPIISVLTPTVHFPYEVFKRLQQRWPSVEVSAPPFVFDSTHYYEDEMGYPLFRWWVCRNHLADPSKLTNWKQTTQALEDELSNNAGQRSVNIDPGYINYGLVVLGSGKYDLQKIYLGENIYADPVLQYGEGEFQAFDWSFPDFKEPDYYPVLKRFRRRYKELRNQ